MSIFYSTTAPPSSLHPVSGASHNVSASSASSLDRDLLDRTAIRELTDGWPAHRDAAEWPLYRSIFHDDAYIATSWFQGPIDAFIEASKEGFEKQGKDEAGTGVGFPYILHRVTGQSVELSPEGLQGETVKGRRAVAKIKITITCRFAFTAPAGTLKEGETVELDNEADCRFFFLLEQRSGRWGAVFYTLLFDKDKMAAVNAFDTVLPSTKDLIPEAEVKDFPQGYRYLAYCESKLTPKSHPKMDLNAQGPERDVLYEKCKDWLEGRPVGPNLTGPEKIDY